DATSGRKEREIPVRGVDQILHPAWAPDGHAIAFAGLTQGLSDLYLYDLRASSLQRLTNDAFAEMHPAWSPDSRTIAFATDRFTTNLDTLAIGRYELATIEPASGRVQRIPTFAGADSINPQWSRDGRELYFIANPSGIADVYGVSTANGAALPPATRKESDVAALLADSEFGLPPRQPQGQAQVTDYKASLALEGIGQPSVGIGVNRFGSTIGGGVSFYFSDLLGNHMLATAVQMNSGIGNN